MATLYLLIYRKFSS